MEPMEYDALVDHADRERFRQADAFMHALLRAAGGSRAPEPARDLLPGHLCEVCLDAPAVALQPAPWGGEMGVCETCQGREG